MQIIFGNVNSLRAAESKFLEFMKDYSPDMIFLQEVRAFEHDLSFFLKQIDNYEYFINDSGKPLFMVGMVYCK